MALCRVNTADTETNAASAIEGGFRVRILVGNKIRATRSRGEVGRRWYSQIQTSSSRLDPHRITSHHIRNQEKNVSSHYTALAKPYTAIDNILFQISRRFPINPPKTGGESKYCTTSLPSKTTRRLNRHPHHRLPATHQHMRYAALVGLYIPHQHSLGLESGGLGLGTTSVLPFNQPEGIADSSVSNDNVASRSQVTSPPHHDRTPFGDGLGCGNLRASIECP